RDQEFLKRGDGSVELTVLQQVERGLIGRFVVVAGRRRTSGRTGGAGRSSLPRPGSRAAAPPRLEGLHAPIEVGIQIVLLLAAGLESVGQLIDVVVHGAQI